MRRAPPSSVLRNAAIALKPRSRARHPCVRGCWWRRTGPARPCAAFAGIATVGWDYGQSAIVATIAHERDHSGRAEQHFLPAGPFAMLPLRGRRSSIVWSEAGRRSRNAAGAGAGRFQARARISLPASTWRNRTGLTAARVPARLSHRAPVRRLSPRADRRRGPSRSSARRARPQSRASRRRRAG